MSFKCQVCKQPQPAGTQRKLHVIRRKDGSVQRELAVCDPCHAVLVGGVPVRQAMVEAGTATPMIVEPPQEIAPLSFKTKQPNKE